MCPRSVSPTLISRLYFSLLSNYLTDIHLGITEIPLTPHIQNGSSSLPALPPNLLLFLAPFSFFSPRLPLPTQLPQAVSVNPSPYLICPSASGHHILVGCPRDLRNRPPLSSPKAAGPAQATESAPDRRCFWSCLIYFYTTTRIVWESLLLPLPCLPTRSLSRASAAPAPMGSA